MIAIWIIISLVSFYIFWKWIALFLLAPIIRIHSIMERKKAHILLEEDRKAYLKKNENISNPTAENDLKKGFFNNAKFFIYNILSGYERYVLLRVGYIPSHHIRDFIYRNIFLVRMKKTSVIYYGAEIRGPYNLILEEGSIIGDKAVLDARRGYIKIGKNVQLGNEVNMWTGSHDMNDPWFRSIPGKRGPIEIDNYVWIGPRATILNSIKIGEGAVIAAGAVVTKDVAPYSIMAGVPAKKIGVRNNRLYYKLGKHHVPFY